MRVLVLSQHFWPESFRITDVVRSLHEAGCDITVLTGQPNYPKGDVFGGYSAWKVKREIHDDVLIHRVPLFPRGRGGAVRMTLNYLSFVATASILGPLLLRGQPFDVIFIYGVSPILQAIPGIVLGRTKGAAVVTWVQDLWPDSLEATGFVRSRRVLRAVEKVVRWIYRRNDLILVQSHAFVDLVRRLADRTPIEYHPNPGDVSFESDTLPVPRLTLGETFNIVFAGNFGTVQALETVLEAAGILLPNPDIRFVLIGAGSRRQWLAENVNRRGLSNVHISGPFLPLETQGILTQASALLVTLARNSVVGETVPSKLQAYLAAGRPIIAALDGEGARIVQEARAGLSCRAEDPIALAQVALTLQQTPLEDLREMGQRGRAYYDSHFASRHLADELIGHFRSAVQQRVLRTAHGRKGYLPPR